MKGFSPYKIHTPDHKPGLNSTTDGDEVSGRTQIEEIKYDIEDIKKSIAKHSANPNAVKKLKEALKQNQEALVRLQKNK